MTSLGSPDRFSTIDFVAGVGLREFSEDEIRDLEGISEVEWTQFHRELLLERLVPLAAYALDQGALTASDIQRAQITQDHARSMSLAVVLERRLLEVYSEMSLAGIDARVLKGSAVAHLDYPDPSWRAFGDVDLLVPADSFAAASEILTAAGAPRRFAEVSKGFDSRFGKGACFVYADGLQVDLHRSIAEGPFGLTVDLDSLFNDVEEFEIGGVNLRTISRQHRFMHACFHAALGDVSPRLVALRDVAEMLLVNKVDLSDAVITARAWRAEAVIARAISLAWQRIDLPPNDASAWANTYSPSGYEERALRAYTSENRSYATQVAAGVTAVPGITGKLAYMRALLLPSRQHISGRDSSYWARFRRGAAALRESRSSQ
ncbi:MAG: nucleotidyltransferase family protein [Acidimicrobiia bacterium]|nr:nucleotidyltransferase family protein [Acidimicrobiia bacterium]